MSLLQRAGPLRQRPLGGARPVTAFFLHAVAKNLLLVGLFYLHFVLQAIAVGDPGVAGENALGLSTIFLLGSLAAELTALNNEER